MAEQTVAPMAALWDVMKVDAWAEMTGMMMVDSTVCVMAVY